MKIIIRSNVGLSTPATVECEPADAVGTLLNKVSADQGITDSGSVALSLNGKPLDNRRRVKEYGIADGDTLDLVPSHRRVGTSSPSSFSFSVTQGSDLPQYLRNRLAMEARVIMVKKLPLVMDLYNPLHWTAKVRGSGKWRGQNSIVEIYLSKKYPRKMPQIVWKTLLVPKHPNIFPKTTGWVCVSSLKKENWRATQTLSNIYEEMVHVMDHPRYHHYDRPVASALMGADGQGNGFFGRMARRFWG